MIKANLRNSTGSFKAQITIDPITSHAINSIISLFTEDKTQKETPKSPTIQDLELINGVYQVPNSKNSRS